MIKEMFAWNDIAQCFPVFVQAYPQYDLPEFTARMDRQYAAGYRLVASIFADDVYGVAIYHVDESITTGKIVVIDDLILDKRFRAYGVGVELLSWFANYATQNSCADIRFNRFEHCPHELPYSTLAQQRALYI